MERYNKITDKNQREILLLKSFACSYGKCAFCNYILDKQNGNENLEYITSFILKHNNDSSFKEQIDKIREGVILYSGIKFNNDINKYNGYMDSSLDEFTEINIKTRKEDLLKYIDVFSNSMKNAEYLIGRRYAFRKIQNNLIRYL